MGKPSGKNDSDWYRYGGGEKQGDTYQPAAALPNSLFLRNIALETSADTIRSEFEIFGPIRDVYLPKEFSTGMPKGYGFIKFQNGEDAKMAKEHLNHRLINGQEICIAYSSDANRKKPRQMALINSRTRLGELASGSRSPRQHDCNSVKEMKQRERSGDGLGFVGQSAGNKRAHHLPISQPLQSRQKGTQN